MEKHPITTPRSAISIALVATVLSLGEPFMPPSCFYFIVVGCYLAALAIVWLCWKEIEIIAAGLRDGAKTMKIPADFYITIGLGFVAFVVPTIMLVRGPHAQTVRPPLSSTNQSGGQAGSITNNGPTYNGPVFADDPSKCPPGYNVIEGLDTWGNGKDGVRTSGNVRLCIVNSKSHDNKGYGYNFESK